MRCMKCQKEFEEVQLQLSHDVPKYIGGTDRHGGHWLCIRCHKDYEIKVAIKMLQSIPEHLRIGCRSVARGFAKKYFKEVREDDK